MIYKLDFYWLHFPGKCSILFPNSLLKNLFTHKLIQLNSQEKPMYSLWNSFHKPDLKFKKIKYFSTFQSGLAAESTV